MIEIDISKIKKTFAIYANNDKFRVILQYKNDEYTGSFENVEEGIIYIKNIIGQDEYTKREF